MMLHSPINCACALKKASKIGMCKCKINGKRSNTKSEMSINAESRTKTIPAATEPKCYHLTKYKLFFIEL